MEDDLLFCTICKQLLPSSKFVKGGSGKFKPSCHKCESDRWKAQVKFKVFFAFGFKCACCGENNPYFLTLDHRIPHTGGHPYKKGLNTEQIYQQCVKDGFDPDKYQLLCMNCNFAKGVFGACPHTTGVSPAQALVNMLIKSGVAKDELVKMLTDLGYAQTEVNVN